MKTRTISHPISSSYRILALLALALPCLLVPGCKSAPPPPTPMENPAAIVSTPLKFESLDPAAGKIIPAGAQLERVATGFTWTEGPIWAGDRLFFAEITSNSIRTWTPGQGVSIFLQPSGYKGSAPYGGPEPGSNGMTLDARGRLTVAGHAQRDVYRFESLSPTAQITILADSYQGKRLNSPNDLVYGVYRIPHALDQAPGAPPDRAHLQLLIGNLPRPNGIAFSPGEKYLYVDNSQPKKQWWRYTVRPNGSLADPKLLYDATSDPRTGGPDGMKVDVEGNIYGAGPGGVWIFSPAGKHLATLDIPTRVANMNWAGPDRQTLYIAASGNIYRVHLLIAGEPTVQSK